MVAWLVLLDACASKDDTIDPAGVGTSAGSSDGGTDESSGPEPMTSASATSASATSSAPEPYCGDDACDAEEDCGTCPSDCNACPASCGDGQCGADETCDSCATDCGECCGDGSCDGDEDWASCWGDCSAGAPMLEFEGLYAGCSGQTVLLDGDPDADYLWVRADTRALMYVVDDVVYEIAGSDVVWESDYWNAVRLDGETVGYILCADAVDGCAATIATYSTCEVPQPPGQDSSEVVDFTIEGNAVSAVEGDLFVACDSLCGNGTCDAQETSSGCTNISHVCDADC